MILDMLKDHNKHETTSFHMPGHKNGNVPLDFILPPNILAYDTTELCDTDALIQPQDTILEAEKKAAKLYGAEHSFYLVNGSTGGVLTMMYVAFSPGDVVLVDRYCHMSVLNGCMLRGIQPVYITPETSRVEGIPGVVSVEMVSRALKQYPMAKGLVLTSPNYYGAAADLTGLAELIHTHRGLLLVDEAHGAHFPFSACFPPTAMEQGADISVTSLHKSLPAPNQTALLHVGKGFNVEHVRSVLRMLQTSSPSYLLLAAMEQALDYSAQIGRERTAQIVAKLKAFNCPTLEDPFKLLPDWRHKGLTGTEVDTIFREQFGIYPEMFTTYGLLLMVSWCNSDEDFNHLGEALEYCSCLPDVSMSPVAVTEGELPPISVPMDFLSLSDRDMERISLERAEGRICGTSVSAFPPCIPIILPGEIISREQISYLQQLKRQGCMIVGINEGIPVVDIT
ncbi:MAG: aminotransferase class I/II-fold pyridoxal phosphate-dependent enzyme [Ruminococcaceae bacterium]|nr:aminotransferase class I/II-fold pyridoxal phosphate-dependent enzyme [Oscillospiraceae bacterium]